MTEAMRPDFLQKLATLKRAEGVSKPTEEEIALHSMAQTSGWKIFKDLAERVTAELGDVNKQAIASGLPLEEIGRNAVIITLAQGVIERLLNKVTDASEACERKD